MSNVFPPSETRSRACGRLGLAKRKMEHPNLRLHYNVSIVDALVEVVSRAAQEWIDLESARNISEAIRDDRGRIKGSRDEAVKIPDTDETAASRLVETLDKFADSISIRP